jgi:hypothetical protein
MLSLLLISSVGCEKFKGDKGDVGPPGPGTMEVLTGVVVSNQFTIFDPKVKQANQITVYIGDSNDMAELPYFIPSEGVNTYHLIDKSLSWVEIYNAQLAGAIQYTIVMIL